MLTRDKAAEIFEQIKKHSTADEVEAMIYGGKFALTRFANNAIHQNVAEENYCGVGADGIRRTHGTRHHQQIRQRQSQASCTGFGDSGQGSASRSRFVADAGRGRVARDHTQARPSRHFAQTAALTPELRADGVEKIVRVATRHKLTTAGIFSSSESVEGIFNSRGLHDWHAQTSSEISITMLAADSSGWQKANSPDVSQLDPAALAEISARKAVESASPREIPPGKYTVFWNLRRCSICQASCSGISAVSRSSTSVRF